MPACEDSQSTRGMRAAASRGVGGSGRFSLPAKSNSNVVDALAIGIGIQEKSRMSRTRRLNIRKYCLYLYTLGIVLVVRPDPQSAIAMSLEDFSRCVARDNL